MSDTVVSSLALLFTGFASLLSAASIGNASFPWALHPA